MKHIKLSRLSDRQLRRLLGRAEVRFGYDYSHIPSFEEEKLKKQYYNNLKTALEEIYREVQNYFRSGGHFIPETQKAIREVQEYNPKMAKQMEKMLSDFEQRNQKLLALLRHYLNDVTTELRKVT